MSAQPATKPSQPPPAKARPHLALSNAPSQVHRKLAASPESECSFDDLCASPQLLPAPPGALDTFLRVTARASADNPESRFCTHAPRLEFGGAVENRGRRQLKCSLRVFASRLHTSVSQACVLLLERLSTLKACLVNLDHAASGQLLELASGVQAASYHMQKWSVALALEGALPSLPSRPDNAEEAMAILHLAVPRVMIASSVMQTHLRKLVPRIDLPCELGCLQEFDSDAHMCAIAEAEIAAEAHGEAELRGRNMSIEDFHRILPHMENLVYLASSLINSLHARRLTNVAPVDMLKYSALSAPLVM